MQKDVSTVSLDDIDNVTPKKLKELEDCFKRFDIDESGSISAREFQYALTKLNIYIDNEEIRDLFSEYDTDGDSSLDFEEFIKLVAKLDPRLGQEIEINKAFKLYDKNQDGYITRSEVMDALTRFGITASEADIDLIFTMTDDNNDGLINHAEFRNMLYDAPPPPESTSRPGSRPGSRTSSPRSSRTSSPGFNPSFGRSSPKYKRTSYSPPAHI